jgi:catechol 2,3-dioxygenase-like lactoylglutathione lyase family enzyme
MTISRMIPNICSDCLPETRDFYVELLGFQVQFESDWYVQVAAPGQPRLELGIMQRDHELVPEPFQTLPAGTFLTVVVDNVDDVYTRAMSYNLSVIQPPCDEFYGQRRMLLTDPNGLLVDVSTPIAS